jgi:hypothetical protein
MSETTDFNFILSKFPSHIQTSGPSKKKPLGTWKKVGGNTIYAGVHWTTRNSMFRYLHQYIKDELPDNLPSFANGRLHIDIHCPVNWGLVKRTKDKGLSWKPPKKDYKPNWDIDNLAWPWIKAILDTLVRSGVVPEDNISIISGNSYTFVPCDTFEERKIVAKFQGHVLDQAINNAADGGSSS